MCRTREPEAGAGVLQRLVDCARQVARIVGRAEADAGEDDAVPERAPRWRTCEPTHRKKMLTLLTTTKDIDISDAAVLAKLVLS